MANPLLHNLPPLSKAIIFLGFVFMMNIVGSAVGMVGAVGILGVDFSDIMNIVSGSSHPQSSGVMRIVAMATQFFGFLLAAWLFTLFIGKRAAAPQYWKGSYWLLLVPLVYVCFTPILEASIVFNEWLIPEGSWMERIFKPMEESSARVIEQMLETESVGLLLLNLFAVAVLPAIGEEWAFRGILQGQLAKFFKNEHVAIWVTGALFSAFHLQFYGFFPRMMMGVVFGYLLIWTRSMWVPILMHFINNAVAVVLTFLDHRGTVDMESMAEESIQWLWVIPATIGLGASFYYMWKKSGWPQHRAEYMQFQEIGYASSPSAPQEKDHRNTA